MPRRGSFRRKWVLLPPSPRWDRLNHQKWFEESFNRKKAYLFDCLTPYQAVVASTAERSFPRYQAGNLHCILPSRLSQCITRVYLMSPNAATKGNALWKPGTEKDIQMETSKALTKEEASQAWSVKLDHQASFQRLLRFLPPAMRQIAEEALS